MVRCEPEAEPSVKRRATIEESPCGGCRHQISVFYGISMCSLVGHTDA